MRLGKAFEVALNYDQRRAFADEIANGSFDLMKLRDATRSNVGGHSLLQDVFSTDNLMKFVGHRFLQDVIKPLQEMGWQPPASRKSSG